MAKHLPTLCSEAARSADERYVDRLNTKHRIERCRIERVQEGQKDHRRLGAMEDHDCERNPGEWRDWPQQFENGKHVVLEALRPPEEQPERNADGGGQEERNRNAAHAHPDMEIVLLSEN